MEDERESITQMRVGLYRKALAELREENELAAREAERTKAAEAHSVQEADVKMAKSTGHRSSDKA